MTTKRRRLCGVKIESVERVATGTKENEHESVQRAESNAMRHPLNEDGLLNYTQSSYYENQVCNGDTDVGKVCGYHRCAGRSGKLLEKPGDHHCRGRKAWEREREGKME
jgi:hypothetical protein